MQQKLGERIFVGHAIQILHQIVDHWREDVDPVCIYSLLLYYILFLLLRNTKHCFTKRKKKEKEILFINFYSNDRT